MNESVLIVHEPKTDLRPLVLDSPHSGHQMPPDFDSVRTLEELREGEDCFIDELYLPATARGVPLLAALFPRTYLDANRHAGDVDLDLLDEAWPHEHRPSGKGSIGKSLVWRTLDEDRPIYDRRLSARAVRRIDQYHRPYHRQLQTLLDAAHARFGRVYHINCHSMGPNTTVQIEGTKDLPRADIVLGDRDGTTCAPEFTAFVRAHLAALGYDVRLNDPFKGVELVRAYANWSFSLGIFAIVGASLLVLRWRRAYNLTEHLVLGVYVHFLIIVANIVNQLPVLVFRDPAFLAAHKQWSAWPMDGIEALIMLFAFRQFFQLDLKRDAWRLLLAAAVFIGLKYLLVRLYSYALVKLVLAQLA
jgi:N-formylglutamate amidohydrolase